MLGNFGYISIALLTYDNFEDNMAFDTPATIAILGAGPIGLETALGVVLTRVVGEGVIDLPTMVDRMSCAPARAFNLPGGTLEKGAPADVTVFDPAARWTVDPTQFRSKSRNTPFAGWELQGLPRLTIVGGTVVFEG